MFRKKQTDPTFFGFQPNKAVAVIFVFEWIFIALKSACVLTLRARPDIALLAIIMLSFGAWALIKMLKFRNGMDPKYLYPYITWKTSLLAVEALGILLLCAIVVLLGGKIPMMSQIELEPMIKQQKSDMADPQYQAITLHPSILVILLVGGTFSIISGMWCLLYTNACRIYLEEKRARQVPPEASGQVISPCASPHWSFNSALQSAEYHGAQQPKYCSALNAEPFGGFVLEPAQLSIDNAPPSYAEATKAQDAALKAGYKREKLLFLGKYDCNDGESSNEWKKAKDSLEEKY